MEQNREQAKELYRDLLTDSEKEGPQAVKHVMGELGKHDLFFLLTVLCGRKDIDKDWLFDRCREVQAEPNGYLDLWAREHYKMLRCDEPIATPSGWTTHGALKPGDLVYGPDGEQTMVVARTDVFTDGDAFEISFDDGTTMQAGADHLWDVERRTRKRIAGTANGRRYRETVTLSTRDIHSHRHTPDNRLAITVNDPLNMPDVPLPIKPYTMGAWLGDGTAAGGGITGEDKEIFEAIIADGYMVGENTAPCKPNAETRTVYGIRPLLRSLGILNNKHIPACYQRGSIKQRMELLRGLMDTDGHCNTRGTATFTNISKQLVDGVYELATGLGMKPSVYEYTNEFGPVWQVAFQAYQEANPFKLTRKAIRAKPGARPHPRRYITACKPVAAVPMSCIQVDRDDGLYLAGRQMVTTHNSTIITFGLTIQDIINDPEITFGFFSINRPVAKKFLFQLKSELESNTALKELYPEVLWADPGKESPRWSLDEGIIVKRKSNPKEATVEANGLVDSLPTSRHYKIRVYDDMIDDKNVTNPDMILKSIQAWELSLSLGSTQISSRYGTCDIERYAGTRYHFNDSYAEIMRRKAAKVRCYPGTKDGKEDGDPVLWTKELIQEKRRKMGPYIFGCQILQNPVADKAQGFKKEWLRFWDGTNLNNLNFYIICDPASSKKKGSDYTVFWVIGVGSDRKKYQVDTVRDRLNLKERTDMLFFLHEKYKPLRVGYEKYGMQSDIEHIKGVQETKNYRFDIVELGGQVAKEDRIRGLIPDFENGNIYLLNKLVKTGYDGRAYDVVEQFINDEYMSFPVSLHDDLLDGLARINDSDMRVEVPNQNSTKWEIPKPSGGWMSR